MNGIKKHLKLFPPRLQRPLTAFSRWDSICEIRLRRNLPLSLTDYNGNLFLSEDGRITAIDGAIRCTGEEIRNFVSAFCGGAVYRYFDTLREGFLVDDDGWRLGLCPRGTSEAFLPECFEGVNLRIPRAVPEAADLFLNQFSSRPLSSTLILSPPGDGKTTLLRALALSLSRGSEESKPLRVAVVDERMELFPSAFLEGAGLCDVLSGYEKNKGIEIATRVFSPQVILCDEIGSDADAEALIRNSHSGVLFFASAHGRSTDEGALRPGLQRLLREGIFQHLALIERIPSPVFRSRILWKDL